MSQYNFTHLPRLFVDVQRPSTAQSLGNDLHPPDQSVGSPKLLAPDAVCPPDQSLGCRVGRLVRRGPAHPPDEDCAYFPTKGGWAKVQARRLRDWPTPRNDKGDAPRDRRIPRVGLQTTPSQHGGQDPINGIKSFSRTDSDRENVTLWGEVVCLGEVYWL